MTEFEKRLRELASKDLGSALELLVDEFGEGQPYFFGQTGDGLSVFIHTKDNEQDLAEAMEQGIEVIQDGIEDYELLQDAESNEEEA